ncbi:uncharacterized protein LOC117340738 [Pecten maximus]|uniref:uncharacterized protein LOC117340738 n=1 Tax=Pecten maximus TaxID=6579 RepID=UPI001458A36A|nr:uncharacterized protein LOC117340738 [Pecten maximus]
MQRGQMRQIVKEEISQQYIPITTTERKEERSQPLDTAMSELSEKKNRERIHSQSDIIIQTTPSIVIGYDDLDIRCSPHPSWSIQSITRIQIYKNTKGPLGSSASEVVFMYLNLTVLAEQFQWSDLSVKARGVATGSLSPTIDSFMRLLVPESSTLCEDAASYRCEISGTNFGAPSSRSEDFSIGGLVFGRVTLNSSTNITLRQDALEIGCFQGTTGEGLERVDRLEIFRYSKDGNSMTRVVSVVLDNATGQSVLEFHDLSLKARAVIAGNITAPSSAFIMLLIPANSSVCDDITTYRCQLTATSVADTVVSDYKDVTIYAETLPEEISPLQIQDSIGRICTARGSSIRWCIRRYGGLFTEYPKFDDITTSDVYSVDACQNSQNSTLTYNVTSGDIETTFMCEIGNGGVCGNGIVTSQVSIYAVDMAISADVPGAITAGVNELLIRCSQTASGIGLLREPEIRLYRNTSVMDDSIVLSLAVDSSTNQSTITWFDEDFKTRATAAGNIINITSAYLNISVNSSHVNCLDAGNYRCDLGGHIGSERIHFEDRDSLDVIVRPDHMEEILVRNDNDEPTDKRSFPVGTSLTLTCNSTVGIPPHGIIWCVRRAMDDEFISLGSGNSSVPVPSGSCQYRQTSELRFNVTNMDSDTVVQCEVGNFSTCGTGIVSREVRINAVDVALTTDVTSIVTSGDRLNVTCFQSASGLGELQHTYITLYRNTSDGINETDERVVSLRYNSTSNTSVSLWHDDDLVTRATVTGDVTDPGTAYLSLSVSNVTCLDQGVYRCEMTGVTPTNSWRVRGDSKLIQVNVPAESVHDITGKVGDRFYTDRGSFRSGTEVLLTCNATVGAPPGNLTWCVMRAGENEYTEYNDTLGRQSEPIPIGQCQYMRTSVAKFTVTSRDSHTLMTCVVGQNSTCDGNLVSGVFEIFAVDVSIDLSSTPEVIGGFDAINMTCNVSDVTSFTRLEVMLYRNTSDQDTAIVSFDYNVTTSSVTWLDNEMEHRAAAEAWVEGSSAILEMSLGQEVTCSDEGYYTCVMRGDMGSEETLVQQDQQYTKVIELPDSISDVAVQTDSGLYAREGVFPVGSNITLLCNSTVGRPPLELHWCVRRVGQTPVAYEGIVNQTEPIPFGNCQFSRTSSLVYTVMSEDTRTEFICDVGSNGTCGDGHLSSVFTLYAAVVSVKANSTPLATSGLDNINITCSVTGLRLFDDWMIHIYQNASGDSAGETMLISMVHSGTNNSTLVVWWYPELQTRADYSTDLTQTDTAMFELSFQGDHVTCLDGGLYRCELSGTTSSGDNERADDTTPVLIVVPPGHIEEVRGEGDDVDVFGGGVFPVESGLVLTCNSSAGNPPMDIYWCVMTDSDSQWSLYPNTSHITQSEPTSGSCDLWRVSTLQTEVRATDVSTRYLCEVGQNLTCGQGLLNSSFSVYAVDVDVDVAIQGTSTVIGGIDELQITCSQNASGIGLLENTTIGIYHQTEGLQRYLLVSLAYNMTTGSDIITWHTPGMKELWFANGSTTPLNTAFLELTLTNVSCRESGSYECVLQGQVGSYYDVMNKDRMEVNVKVLPDRIEPIEGRTGSTAVTDEGRFLVGQTVCLLCNSTVGDPPANLYWRYKRANDTDYTLHNATDQSEPTASGSCQLRRISRLPWTVTSADIETRFNCMVGQTHVDTYFNATFTIVAIPCDGDCSVLTTPVSPILSDGMTSAVIVASIIAPLLLLAVVIALIGLWKFPGARALLCKRKSYGPKVEPHDSGLDIPLDLNCVGSSAPPTGTSLANGSAMKSD